MNAIFPLTYTFDSVLCNFEKGNSLVEHQLSSDSSDEPELVPNELSTSSAYG